tara:strand:+ start:169 stop:2544 length:2376 start_codon:yes stop_codon:yes gene_type:complete
MDNDSNSNGIAMDVLEDGLGAWNQTRIDAGLVKSQKARALFEYGVGVFSKPYGIGQTMLILVEDDPVQAFQWFKHHVHGRDAFVRTCPLTPRHGVLESTRCAPTEEAIVETVSHLQQVLRDEDPEGCLIIQPFEIPDASCVMAPSMYVDVGEGHDGVTAGQGLKLRFPLQHSDGYSPSFAYVFKHMGLDMSRHEIEMVSRKMGSESTDGWAHNGANIGSRMSTVLTQIRGCDEHVEIDTPPEGVTINGAVPSGTVVATHVFEATGLEEVAWLEENITKDKVPEGFVISEPEGSLLSHIFAHARSHGIPYVVGTVEEGQTWTEPARGWVVENSDGKFEANPYNPFEYIDAFRDGVAYGNRYWRRKHAYFSNLFHQWIGHPRIDPKVLAYFGGVFTAWLVKATVAACMGEMRHARSRKKNLLPATVLALRAIVGRERVDNNVYHEGSPVMDEREPYHDWMAETYVDWEGAQSVLDMCARMYATGWYGSFGGKKWGDGAEKGAKVAGLLAKLETAGPEELMGMAGELTAAVNALENAQHNNGALLNKFGGDVVTAFDYGTNGYSETDMGHVFATYLLARDVMEGKLTDKTQPCEWDWKEIADWVSSKPAKFWRENPVFTTEWMPEDMPAQVVLAVLDLRSMDSMKVVRWMHGSDGHSYSQVGTPGYVPCNHKACQSCKTHAKLLDQTPITAASAHVSPNANVDVWPIETMETETTAVLKPRVVATLRELIAKQTAGDIVTMAEIVDGFAKAYSGGHMEFADKHIGVLLHGLSTTEFVMVMEAITQVKAETQVVA